MLTRRRHANSVTKTGEFTIFFVNFFVEICKIFYISTNMTTELVYTKKGGLKIQHSITEQHLQFYTVVAL